MRLGGILCHGQVFFLALLVVSCTGKTVFSPPKKNGSAIAPPPTPLLSRSVIGYGVVGVTYTVILSEPSPSGFSLGHLRKGDILEIVERRRVNNSGLTESWVLVRDLLNGDSLKGGGASGWLRENVIQIYDNEARARTAARFSGL
jgi:hypothetical protein